MKRKLIATAVVIFILFFINCSTKQDSGLDAAGVAANNRGVGLMGQFNYEEAQRVFEELAQKYPRNGDIKVNLAIAVLNRQKEGDEKIAFSIVEEVLRLDPENIRARYCAGLLELHMGRPAEALGYFKAVIAADPRDADVLYFAGKTLMQQSRYEDALHYFKRSISLDNYIRSNYYGMIMALRQLGKTDDAASLIKEFQRLRENPRARLVEFKYTKMGRKAEALAVDLPGALPVKKPSGLLFKAAKPIGGNTKAAWRTIKDRADLHSSITICDMNGDQQPDVFISRALKTANGFGNAVLKGNNGAYTLDRKHPLAGITGVNAALWGDIDGDGRVDVYLCRRDGNQLWYQPEPGKWKDVTGDGITSGGDSDTVDGALFDADHDGDLDIFLINANDANELLNNNRDGSFRPLAAEYGLTGTGTPSRSIVIADLDADRDADIFVINRQPPHAVYINQRLWKYDKANGFDALISAGVTAAAAADVDADGSMEIYTLNAKGVLTRWQANKNNTWEGTPLSKENGTPPAPGNPRLALADVDGDGVQDVLLSDSNGWWAGSFTVPGGTALKTRFNIPASEKTAPTAWSLINSPRGPVLVGWSPGGPPLLRAPGSGRYSFASLQLSGRTDSKSQWRSNPSGIGTRVAVRVDSRWTVLSTYRSDSGPGQGLQPINVGLGGATRIDFAAMDWSDGVFQTELGLEAGKLHRINETQRQLSSCPVIFAWNGTTFAFVSDFLGVGGLGYAIGPGQYSEPRPWENFMLPRDLLQPRNGRLQVKLTEPMEEVAYMDAVRLNAYDLPPGWSMVLDERMGINGPAPTGLPRFYSNILLPVEVLNDRNEDVTAVVTTNDLNAAPVGELDHRFIGRLERDHVLTLRFAQPLDSFPGQPHLLADGWVEYPYSQTSFAAWQAGADYRAPTLEILRPDGKWVVLLEQFGYPAGMPRQMSVPLPPLPKGVRQIRISTNQEIYWDRLAVVFAETCPEVERHELALESAYLEQNGFPLRINRPQRRPDYDYNRRTPFWDIHFLEGFYTRFGGVEELIRVKDNGLVIFGAGEGIHLEYREPPQLQEKGWTRVFVLETEGWCKDMDLYTHTGDRIEPVPSIGKRSPAVERLHKRYNTRYLSGKN